jgi:hypothetical protein
MKGFTFGRIFQDFIGFLIIHNFCGGRDVRVYCVDFGALFVAPFHAFLKVYSKSVVKRC